MANGIYGKGRQKWLEGSIAWLSNNIKLCLTSASAYTVAINTDEFRSDIPSVLATSGNLSTKTSTLGVADADDVTFSAVAAGSQGDNVVGWKDTGTNSTSPLLFQWDTATGLPVTTNGGDITASFDNGTNRILKLMEALRDEERRWALGLVHRGRAWLVHMLLRDVLRANPRLAWPRFPFQGENGLSVLEIPTLTIRQSPAIPAEFRGKARLIGAVQPRLIG